MVLRICGPSTARKLDIRSVWLRPFQKGWILFFRVMPLRKWLTTPSKDFKFLNQGPSHSQVGSEKNPHTNPPDWNADFPACHVRNCKGVSVPPYDMKIKTDGEFCPVRAFLNVQFFSITQLFRSDFIFMNLQQMLFEVTLTTPFILMVFASPFCRVNHFKKKRRNPRLTIILAYIPERSWKEINIDMEKKHSSHSEYRSCSAEIKVVPSIRSPTPG